MRIVSLQYIHNDYNEPLQWLDRIDFYTGIFEQMTKQAEVHSFYHTKYCGTLKKNNVFYHFTGLQGLSLIFPVAFHRQVKKLNPEVIFIQGFHHPFQALLLSLTLGSKIKIFIHHHAERPLRFHKKYLQQFLDKFIIGYFFTSVELAKPWIDKGQIASESKVTEVMECSSIYHPMDRELAKQKVNVNGEKNYLWVGRLEPNKDPITLVNAFIKFLTTQPQAHLYVIYQQDDLLREVSSLAENYPNIFLIGKQDKEQLQHWYNSADFIISTSHYEGSGIAVCEAMSCGCVPILTSIPSFRWMTDGGTCGLLFEKGNVESLLQALMKSKQINLAEERNKTIKVFQNSLSFKAIAEGMLKSFSNG